MQKEINIITRIKNILILDKYTEYVLENMEEEIQRVRNRLRIVDSSRLPDIWPVIHANTSKFPFGAYKGNVLIPCDTALYLYLCNQERFSKFCIVHGYTALLHDILFIKKSVFDSIIKSRHNIFLIINEVQKNGSIL